MEEELVAETENFAVIRSNNEDGDIIYHIELGSITLHLLSEEWEEFLTMVSQIE